MDDAQFDLLLRRLTRGDVPPPGMALTPATVALTGSDEVVVDGDTARTPILSLIGPLNTDDRVMVLFWPPHGAYVIGRITQGEWVDVTGFGTNWANFGGASEPVQYRRDGPWVTLRGVATYTAGQALGIFTLPVGFRPAARENFAVDTNPQVHGVITPSVAGVVEFVAGPGAAAGYVSVSGVRFWAA